MAEMMLWPVGPATVLTPAFAANLVVEVRNRLTILQLPNLTGVMEIDLELHTELKPGHILVIEANQGATGRDITLGDGFEGQGIEGVANDKDTLVCMYNGTAFRVISREKTHDEVA